MKKLLIGLVALTSLSAFAADCDSLVGDYLCLTKYSKTTVQIEKTNSGYKVTEIDHTGNPFSKPGSQSSYTPKCVANEKLDYKESYYMATFSIKIRTAPEGIQIEDGFDEAKETRKQICISK